MIKIKNLIAEFATKHQLDLFVLISFYILWLINTYDQLLLPSLSGYDSVTRLYNSDKLLITVNGNTWLPLLQFFIRELSLFTGDLYVFKAFNFLISTFGITLYYFVIKRLFGLLAAVVSLSFFLMHVHWTGVATSVYMEPLFLLSLSAAILFYLNNQKILFSVFFILATFSRPELLIAAPVIVVLVTFYQKSLWSGIKLLLLYLPVVTFYIWLKFSRPEFQNDYDFNFSLSVETFLYLIDVYLKSYTYLLQGLLVIAGIVILFFNKNLELQNKKLLKYIFFGLVSFVIIYVLVVPLLHSAIGSVGRKSLFIVLLSFLYIAISFQYLNVHYSRIVPPLLAIFATLAVCYGYYNADRYNSWQYNVAKKISEELSQNYPKAATHYICNLEAVDSNYDYVKGIMVNQLLFYLNQQDWKFEFINCGLGKEWQRISRNKSRALLLIYDKKSLSPDFFRQIPSLCTTSGLIRKYGRVIGRYCF